MSKIDFFLKHKKSYWTVSFISLSLYKTYIGSVLVSVNPYRELEIYSKQNMERHRGVNFYEISPHMWVLSVCVFMCVMALRIPENIPPILLVWLIFLEIPEIGSYLQLSTYTHTFTLTHTHTLILKKTWNPFPHPCYSKLFDRFRGCQLLEMLLALRLMLMYS